ncbi:DUF2332 domain-containing protein [Kineosporia rhizophila]|uniref:DUF2332 domain-containing protein n=1 Tax=Kineosporia rhizophila TaxID=84633 RepID=UPI001E4C79AC|nr:DUF2332 domain-containing protein [Kineosporia rhizophila]MCE0538067.1 DUF2332 domain-containing protein [Kineosporia rhizophila]
MATRTRQDFQRFADSAANAKNPLYQRVARALSESDEALAVVEGAPGRKRRPALVFAALHDLALSGRAEPLARAYAADDAEAAAPAAIQALLSHPEHVVELLGRRTLQADEFGRYAVLWPVIAEAAHRAGAETVGLVDVMCSAGLNLNVGRVGIAYSNGQFLGDATSPVQLAASVVGKAPLPTWPMPRVAARVGLDPDPIDTSKPEDARWLRACVEPSQREQLRLLEAELDLAATDPPVLVKGDVLDTLPTALAQVPTDVLPIVLTTWALRDLALDDRLRFLHRLDEAAATRPLAWISVEGVGVAPAVPTFGDRRASGHSIIGLALLEGSKMQVEAVGRSWSQGRMLSWTAG